jgi:hypothetical protein
MFLTAVLLLTVSALPGYALCRVLDGSADKTRKLLLSPALGLLLVYGISGALLYTNLWTFGLMSACLLLLNAYALAHTQRRVSDTRSFTPWQALEAAMHGEVSAESTPLSEEATTQQWFQSHRRRLPFAIGVIVALSCFTLPFLQSLPFGVDWIGFSMLSGQISLTGNMGLPGTNEGFWTYPPAFPSLAAWLQGSLGLSSGTAVFQLGHYSLFALVLGIGGAMDRHGAGAQGLMAMGLGAGLFAKVFDSGYPTVASQLGLVVGLLVLLRPSSARGKHHTRGFILAFLCVILIHPTGAIYLGMLMAAHLIIGLRLDEKHGANIQKILVTSAFLLTAAAAVALLVLAPRMLEASVFAEYGWQGGRPLMTYNVFLLAGGGYAAWRLRTSVEGMLLATWFAGLWLLSGIHLVEGLEQIPILSLLSYVLYSMGLHAFHVPLAALLALIWSDSTNLTSIEQKRGFVGVGWDPHLHRHLVTGLQIGLMIAVLFGNAILVQVSEHNELRPVTEGDVALLDDVRMLPSGSVVYSENAQWGYVLDAPSHVQFTSLPTLGLVQLEASIQSRATTAVYADNSEQIGMLNITHAISSPIGTLGWYLGASTYWNIIAETDGSILWSFDATGQSSIHHYAPPDASTCTKGCEERTDPWRDHRFRDPLGLGDTRPFVEESVPSSLTFSLPTDLNEMVTPCLVYEAVGDLDGLEMVVSHGQNSTTFSDEVNAGWHSTCFETMYTGAGVHTLTIGWSEEDATSSRWLNPLGISQRGDALIDRTGIRVHWLEFRS